jgi:ribosomal protein S18 acetylase RimI-like enzyme/ketosteroid isomerase-like protein
MPPKIRTCTAGDAALLAETIRTSFRTVAERFGLTRENAARHPSNCEEGWVLGDMERGVVYYVLEGDGRVAGCVALERVDGEGCYLERLAVLPGFRRRGFGKTMVAHVFSEARRMGLRRVGIAMIAEQAELKEWYGKLGFVEKQTKGYAHLPFRVTFLSFEIPDKRRDLIERYIAAYNAFDVEGMLALMNPEVVFRNIAGGEVTAETEGIEALRALAMRSKGLFSSRRQEIKGLSLSGNRASADIAFEGVLAVDLPGGPKAGDTLRIAGRSEFEFRDGSIARITDIN